MAKSWSDIANSDEYVALPPEQRQEVKSDFFERTMAPAIPAEHLDAVRSDFMGRGLERDLHGMRPETAAKANAIKRAVADGSMTPEQGTDALTRSLRIPNAAAFLSSDFTIPERDVGAGEAAARAAVVPMTSIGLGALRVAKGAVGMVSEPAAQALDRSVVQPAAEAMRQLSPRPEEHYSTGAKVAAGVGTVAGMLPAAMAPGAAAGAAPLTAAAAGAAPFAGSAAVNKYADLREAGVDAPRAAAAAAVEGAGQEALGILPMGTPLKALRPAIRYPLGAAVGAVENVAGSEGLRRTENAILPENAQQAAPDGVDVAIEAGTGAAFGAHGSMLHAPKSDLRAGFDAVRGKFTINDDGSVTAPSGARFESEQDAASVWHAAGERRRSALLSQADGSAVQQRADPAVADAAAATKEQWLQSQGFKLADGALLDAAGQPVSEPQRKQLQQHLQAVDPVVSELAAAGRDTSPDSVLAEMRYRQGLSDLNADLQAAKTPTAKRVVQQQIQAWTAQRAQREQVEQRKREIEDLQSLAAAAGARGDGAARAAYLAAIDKLGADDPKVPGIEVGQATAEPAAEATPPSEQPAPAADTTGLEVSEPSAEDVRVVPVQDEQPTIPGIEVGEIPAPQAPARGFAVDSVGNAVGAPDEQPLRASARRAASPKALPPPETAGALPAPEQGFRVGPDGEVTRGSLTPPRRAPIEQPESGLSRDVEDAAKRHPGYAPLDAAERDLLPPAADHDAVAALAHLAEQDPKRAQELIDEHENDTDLATAARAEFKQRAGDAGESGAGAPAREEASQPGQRAGAGGQVGGEAAVKDSLVAMSDDKLRSYARGWGIKDAATRDRASLESEIRSRRGTGQPEAPEKGASSLKAQPQSDGTGRIRAGDAVEFAVDADGNMQRGTVTRTTFDKVRVQTVDGVELSLSPRKLRKVVEASSPDGFTKPTKENANAATALAGGSVESERADAERGRADRAGAAPAGERGAGVGDDAGASAAVPGSDQPVRDAEPEHSGALSFDHPIGQAAHEAATSPHNDTPAPTEAQIEAGNYKKGHVRIQGLDISIENPAGSTRSGTDADGKPWSVDMAHHYGYIRGTKGADKEHVDVFVGPQPEQSTAYVVDQIDPKTGKFDEHKVMLGFPDEASARQAYQQNYAADWNGLGAITPVPVAELKDRLNASPTKPLGRLQWAAARAVEIAPHGRDSIIVQGASDEQVAKLKALGGGLRNKASGGWVFPKRREEAVRAALGEAQPRKSVSAGPDSGATITDVGEKIGGARKDQWRERGLNVADLDAMSDSEGATVATKANVWKPDFTAIADDSDPVTAAMVKVVYDKLAAQPRSDTPEGRRDYVKAMQAVRKVYGSVKSVQEAKDAYQQLRAEIGMPAVRMGLSELSDSQKNARRVLFSIYKGRSDPFVFDVNDLARARQLVNQGFPGAIEPWTRRYAIARVGGNGLTDRGEALYVQRARATGTPLTPEQIRAGAFEVRTKKGEAVGYAVSRVDAEALAKTIYERTKGSADGKTEPSRPHLDKIERDNLPARIDREVTAQSLLDDFGFRGVEFGNWAAQDERRKVLAHAYDALGDLAEILNVPPRALSLNGTMGLAFGARGGGKSAAHYEPGKLVINMTKLRGAGSLAHEWAHALDHYLGELDRADAYKGKARGASGWYSQARYSGKPQERMERGTDGNWTPVQKYRMENLRPELAAQVDAVMKRLYETPIPREEALEIARKTAAQYGEMAAKMDDPRLKSMYSQNAKHAQQIVADLEAGAPSDRTRKSSFAEEAQKLSGKSSDGYWVRPTEMFARAFESYVFDRIKAMGAKSEYLVHGVEPDRYSDDAGYKGNPYPVGEERTAINDEFTKLFDTLKTRTDDRGNVALFRRSEDTRAAYEKRIDELHSSSAVDRSKLRELRMLDRGDVLGLTGFGDLPVYLHEGHAVDDGRYHHGLTAEQWKKMPELVDNPALVLERRSDGHLTMIAPEKDSRGKAIVIGLKPTVKADAFGHPERHLTLTAFPKDRGSMPLDRDIERGEYRPLYIDERKGPEFYRESGLNFSARSDRLRAQNPNLKTGRDLVKFRGQSDLRRNVGSGAGIEIDAAHSVADAAREMLPGLPEIRVVRSEGDLPAAVRDEISRQNAGGARGSTAAVLHDGVIYLNASAANGRGDLLSSILHEGIGHYGLARAFDGKLDAALDDIVVRRNDDVRRFAEKYGQDMNDPAQVRTAAGEFIAYLAESDPKSTLLWRIISAIRKVLRPLAERLGVEMKLTDRDIISQYIRPARGALERAAAPSTRSTTRPDKVPSSGTQLRRTEDDAGGGFNGSDFPDSGFWGMVRQKADYLNSQLLDSFSALKKAQGEKTLPDDQNAYAREQLMHGRTEERLKDLQDDFVKPIGKLIAKAGVKRSDVSDYLYALHAPERNAEIAAKNPRFPDGGSGMTNAESAKIIADFTPEQRAALNDVASLVQKMNRAKLDALRDSGLIEPSLYEALQRKYQHYVPLKSVDDEAHLGIGQGFDIRGKETREAFGRGSRATDPLAVAVQDATRALIRAEKNRVAQAFVRAAMEHPSPELWEPATEDTLPKVPFKDSSGQVQYRVDHGALYRDPHYFSAKFDGEERYIHIKDEDLARQMKKLGDVGFPDGLVGDVVRGVSRVTRLLSSFYTQLNPDFALANFVRDIQHSLVTATAQEVKQPAKLARTIAAEIPSSMKAAAKAVWADLRGGKATGADARLYQQFKSDGGTTGGYGLDDVASIQRKLQRIIDVAEGDKAATALNWAGKALEPIKAMNEVFENATRFAAYKASLEQGLSREQAAVIAKNLTVNFNKRGESSPIFNAAYAFFNASVQANVTVFRAAAKSRYAQGAIASLIGAGVIQEVLGNREQDAEGNHTLDYASEFERDRNIVVPLGDYRLKLPIAYGFNVPFVVGRRLARAVMGNESVPHAIAGIMSAAFDAFSPIHSAFPTMVQPLVDAEVNQRFSGGKIAKQPSTQWMPESSTHYPSANKFFVAVAEGLNRLTGGDRLHKGAVDLSPEKMDYVAQQYLGGPLGFVEALSNLSAPPTGNRSLNDVPFARRFVAEKRDSFDDQRARKIVAEIDQRAKSLKEDSGSPAQGERRLIFDIKLMSGNLSSLEKRRAAMLKQNPDADTSQLDQSIETTNKRIEKIYNDWSAAQ